MIKFNIILIAFSKTYHFVTDCYGSPHGALIYFALKVVNFNSNKIHRNNMFDDITITKKCI